VGRASTWWITWVLGRPADGPASAVDSPRESGDPGLVDDVDEDPPVMAGPGGLDDGPERLRGPPASSDDVPVVILVDPELQHQRALGLVERLDLHLVGMVDERLGEVLEQVARHGALGDALGAQELLHGVAGLPA